MPTATKYIKIILILSCFAMIGCSHPEKEEPTVSYIQEAPVMLESQDSSYCYFIPPKGWELADQNKLSPRVKICFIGKSSNNLLPSVNLATEEVDISLKAYVDIVKRDCESDPNCLWRDLGKYNTSLGEGRLTEREVKTEWGISRQVQLIVIKDQRAYILTAGALKEEFSRHYQDFEGVLGSLTLTNDLTANIPSSEKKELLLKLIENLKTVGFQKEAWEPFQQKIINDFTEMGPYWQILLLRDVQHQLLQNIMRPV
jgi:hypothetical protein